MAVNTVNPNTAILNCFKGDEERFVINAVIPLNSDEPLSIQTSVHGALEGDSLSVSKFVDNFNKALEQAKGGLEITAYNQVTLLITNNNGLAFFENKINSPAKDMQKRLERTSEAIKNIVISQGNFITANQEVDQTEMPMAVTQVDEIPSDDETEWLSGLNEKLENSSRLRRTKEYKAIGRLAAVLIAVVALGAAANPIVGMVLLVLAIIMVSGLLNASINR